MDGSGGGEYSGLGMGLVRDRHTTVLVVTAVATVCIHPESLGCSLVVALIINTIQVCSFLVFQTSKSSDLAL